MAHPTHIQLRLLAIAALVAMSISSARPQVIVYNYSRSGADWLGTCMTGMQQSPINIVHATTMPRTTSGFRLQYEPITNVTLLNNGHTIEISVPPSTRNTLLMPNGLSLPLVNLHFHAFGEHSVNGVLGPLEAHYVHRQTLPNGVTKIAVIAVPFRYHPANADNAFLTQFTSRTLTNTVARYPLQVRLRDLFFPSMSSKSRLNHYYYSGSLTAPPCTEPVSWYVLTNRQTVSTRQVATFVDAVQAVNGGIPINNRTPQPLNGRTVYAYTVK